MKRGIGILLIVSGIIIILSSFSGITGLTIGEGNNGKIISIIGLILVAGGIALMQEGRLEKRVRLVDTLKKYVEKKVEHEEAHDIINYEKLKDRLRWESRMADAGRLIPSPPGTPTKRTLSLDEEKQLKKIFLKYIPEKYHPGIKEISIAGSLSRGKGGERCALKYDPKDKSSTIKYYPSEYVESDVGHLSDVDIGIVSPELLKELEHLNVGFIEESNPTLRGRSTKEMETLPYITHKTHTPEFISHPKSPKWIKRLLLELSKKDFVGKRRNVQFRILSYIPPGEHEYRDVIYQK